MRAFLRVFLIISFIFPVSESFAQKKINKTWEQSFKEVDSLTINGQPKSAYTLVNTLADRARTEGNTVMLIKAVIHRMLFQGKLEEDYFYKIVLSLKNDIQASKQPEKSVLQSLLAESYSEFYQENRYRFAQRTNLSEAGEDIRTWSLKKINSETLKEFLASLSEAELLQRVETGAMKELLAGDSSTRNLRPTLYDLLAHRAITTLLNPESYLGVLQHESISLEDLSWLSDYRTFLSKKVGPADTTSFMAGAIKVFQNLLEYHAASGNKAALADADLKRLQFIYDKGSSLDREIQYLRALDQLVIEASGTEIYPDILYAKALVYNFPRVYSEPRKADFIKVVELADKIVKEYPNSHSAKKAEGMLRQIKEPKIEVKVGLFNLPDMPSQISINYKNVTTVHMNVYRIGVQEEVVFFNQEDKLNEFISNHKPILSWPVSLPEHNDYLVYTSIDKMPPLQVGTYVLMAGSSPQADSKNVSSFLTFKVTSLAVNSRPGFYNNMHYMVLDRKTGNVIENAKVQKILSVLKDGKRITTYGPANSTEKNGLASVSTLVNERQSLVTYKGDSLIVQTRYSYPVNELQPSRFRLILFTDRPIYRPGQTVFFKGLLMQNEDSKNKILAGQEVEISFKDVNRKDISKLKLTTNEYGTIQGSFTVPQGKLNGQMQLTTSYGSINVTVEEYKRPGFEVVFDKSDQQYKLDDSIKVIAKAITYSGYNLSDASVRYTVSRSVFTPMASMMRSYGITSPEQIATGITRSDKNGSFVLPFFAASRVGLKENYTYEIKAEVTDQSGETITNTKTINAGKKDILLNAVLPPELFLEDKPDTLSFTLANLNGQPISGKVKSEWQLLQAPGRLVNPGMFLPGNGAYAMTKDEFLKIFPFESYNDDYNPASWPVARIALTQDINTASGAGGFKVNSKELVAGYYKFKLTAINTNGDTALLEKIINVNHEEPKTIQSMQEWLVAKSTVIAKGQAAEFRVAGALPVSRVYYEVYYKGDVIEKVWVNTSPMQKIIKINPGPWFEVSFAVQFTMVQNGYTYNSLQTIKIEDSAKDLEIKFLSFRDKLQPGEKESWKLSISSKNGEKQMAELAATSYDASLDKLRKMDWTRNLNTSYNYSVFAWDMTQSYAKPASETWFNRRPVQVDYLGEREYEYINQYITNNYENYLAGYNNYMRKLQADRLRQLSTLANKKLEAMQKGDSQYGLVTDRLGYPLPGVAVRSENLSVMTDENGIYKVNAKLGTRIGFSFIGYQSISVVVGNNKRIDVKLAENFRGLSEVVTTAYGSVSPQSNMASSNSVMIRENSSLAGKVAGVEVMEDNSTKSFASYESYDRVGNIGLKPATQMNIAPRTNFSETAFFYPQLRTDSNGEITIDFTIPQSLTRYRMLGFAHTKDLRIANVSRELITQKQLAITANAPRFFREGDTILFSARLNNLAGRELKGEASLELKDALTGNIIQIFKEGTKAAQGFNLSNAGNTAITWPLVIPAGLSAITYKIIALSGNFSDGEEMTIPVLPNSMLVTESIPLNVRANTTKVFTLDKLINSAQSTTLRNHKLTLEFTSNPLWYAIQALPYMIEYPYDCSEQTFTRFYANSFAMGIINSSPQIKAVFESWQKLDNGNALLSNLEKNQELKTILLEETPWVRAAESETERKKRLAVLFDLNRMAYELSNNLDKLSKMQNSNGSFPWFNGMQEDRYITQHIVLGMGQLLKLRLVDNESLPLFNTIRNKAIKYLDGKLKEEQQVSIKEKKVAHLPLHYLYARSYSEKSKDEDLNNLIDSYLKKITETWRTMEPYQQGQAALILSRNGQKPEALKIITMLKGIAQQNEELGMYWTANRTGWWWYQNPVETQSLLIEAFEEVESDLNSVEEMKIWLLKNKQTNDWKTTKATAAACYALLLQVTGQLVNNAEPEISIAGRSLTTAGFSMTSAEAGTGYRKTSIDGTQVKPEMGKVEIKNTNKNIAWGGLYWQYFEQLDKIRQSVTGIKIKKELFLQQKTNSEDILQPINGATSLKPGDVIKVRIEIYSDRDMEYLHLKDMRSSSFEPLNVLSGYKFQDGLGYYESTKDASTNFFINYLSKGVYVFEYPLRVTHSGNFSSGITTLQSMYAPEFTTNSAGIRVNIK